MLRCSSSTTQTQQSDEYGRTVLHLALECNRRDMVEVLLENGADAMQADGQGGALLHLAVACGLPDMAELLLDHNADVMQPDGQGRTPLHLAALSESPKLVAVLLRRGASVMRPDRQGIKPSDLVASCKDWDTKMLLSGLASPFLWTRGTALWKSGHLCSNKQPYLACCFGLLLPNDSGFKSLLDNGA